jgi:metallo-beta-lactamase family protein
VLEVTFVGAAGTVTGSKHLLTADGTHAFVDCGLFQGTDDVRALNDAPLPVAAHDVRAVIATHGHIDHVGYLPKLVRDGFRGTIYCTPATAALMRIVLDDAAHLQQYLAERGFHHERPHAPPPYYDERDVERTMALVQAKPLDEPFDLPGIGRVLFRNAGHVIGSAFAIVEVADRRIVFSGDVGRYGRPLLFDPAEIGPADVIVCESTYGDRTHPPQPLEELRAALLRGLERGGAIVIPAFAVERTQDILYAIGKLQQRDARLAALPVHLDSPMAEKVDDLFASFPQAHRPLGDAQPPSFGCRTLTVHVTTDDSKALNRLSGPHVILSASGMAAGGRVLHHLHNHLADRRATVLFVGYQGAGTLGHLLVHGARSVRIFGDEIHVRAAIEHVEGYSAHADRDDLRRWLATCTGTPEFFAVHGEPESAAALCATVSHDLGWHAAVARRGERYRLA